MLFMRWCDFDAPRLFSQHITSDVIYHQIALSGDMKTSKQKRSGLTRLLLKQTITITLNNHWGNFPFNLTACIFLSLLSSLRCCVFTMPPSYGDERGCLCSVICDVCSNFDRQRHCAAVSSSIPHLHWHFPSAVCLAAFQWCLKRMLTCLSALKYLGKAVVSNELSKRMERLVFVQGLLLLNSKKNRWEITVVRNKVSMI